VYLSMVTKTRKSARSLAKTHVQEEGDIEVKEFLSKLATVLKSRETRIEWEVCTCMTLAVSF
jgi:hypothetical protein